MARLKVNSITDRVNSGPPLLTHGASLPAGSQLTIEGNVGLSASGITTVGDLSATNINSSGNVTAQRFIGDGSGLTGTVTVSTSKAIALKVILDPLPFRS